MFNANAKVMPLSKKCLLPGILVSTFFVCLLNVPLRAQQKEETPPDGIHKVVIDAGHGGKDAGAIGKRAKEKDLALAIALKLGMYIEENIPDVDVIYTRKTDVFVELWKRADIANKAEADLFISIHVNAIQKPSVKGTLTLVLGQHRAGENFDIAVRENSVILLEDNYTTVYEGFDPKSAESYIMFSLMQKTYFKQSIEFGDYVQDQFRERAHRRDLGVREQGLQVLAQTSMPGVLIETGFITNSEEEKYLMSQYGQEIIASAIYRAFKEYKEEIDRRSSFTAIRKEQKSPEVHSEKEITSPEAGRGKAEIYFAVQVASSRKHIEPTSPDFKGHKQIWSVRDGKWFKYLSGSETDYKMALDKCTSIKTDFPDAFVVALKGQKIIPLGEALERRNK